MVVKDIGEAAQESNMLVVQWLWRDLGIRWRNGIHFISPVSSAYRNFASLIPAQFNGPHGEIEQYGIINDLGLNRCVMLNEVEWQNQTAQRHVARY